MKISVRSQVIKQNGVLTAMNLIVSGVELKPNSKVITILTSSKTQDSITATRTTNHAGTFLNQEIQIPKEEFSNYPVLPCGGADTKGFGGVPLFENSLTTSDGVTVTVTVNYAE